MHVCVFALRHQFSSIMTSSRADLYFSIKLSRFLMKVVGFWVAENEREEMSRRILRYYTIFIMVSSMVITAADFYFSSADFYGATYTACALIPVALCLVKISGFSLYRPMVAQIIRYTENHFWNGELDDFGYGVLRDTDKKGILLIYSFTFFVQGTIVCYIVTPLIENIGKNDTDRILAFNIWLNLPTSETPYYELFSVILGFACIHTGLCFCCFDNFLCTLNIHAAAQFKILQNRIETICDMDDEKVATSHEDYRCLYSTKYSHDCWEKFKNCVRQHHALIRYVKDLEQVFSVLVLGQLLGSSVMLCMAGFQASQDQGTIVRRLTFVAHTMGSLFQLFVTTITANEVIVESDKIGTAAYLTLWHRLPYDVYGKKIKEGLIMMMIRSRKPCCITAGRFFPVSLETFTKVSTTSISYFTMLRQVEQEISES